MYNCTCSATINDYTLYVTGAGNTINSYNFTDTSTGGAGTKLGCLYVTASAVLMTVNGYHANGTNGAYADTGYLILTNSQISTCSNSVRAAGIGYIKGVGVTTSGSITYCVLQEDATCTITLVATQIDDFSKMSIVAGSTTFKCNEQMYRDTVVATGNFGAWSMISGYELQRAAQAIPTTLTVMQNRYVQMQVTTLTAPGTIRITGTSYNPNDGTTTPSDTEDFAVISNGQWFVSTKLWQGTVDLTAVSGFVGSINGYKLSRMEQGKCFMLAELKIVTTSSNATNSLGLVVEKWDATNGYVSIWSSTQTNIANASDGVLVRKALNIFFDAEATYPEFLVVRFTSHNNLSKLRMIMVLQEETV
jgi:hypothetical protein